MQIAEIVVDLLIVLAAGFLAGAVCKRIGLSLLVGYMVIGAVIGAGGLQLVSQANHELEYLARAGVLLLLFSVGIEFSLDELIRLSRFIFVGGTTQMLLVAVPFGAICVAFGVAWGPALLAAAAVALSSTVLVFKALAEWGQTSSPHGRRVIGILLCQDIALVPLMLLIPLLPGEGEAPSAATYALLAIKSLLFVGGIALLRWMMSMWIVDALAKLRSVELVVLFTLTVLGGVCFAAYRLGLPPAVGALAAGLLMSGNRLSRQIDTLVLPFRETFAAVFFVTLGTLLDFRTFLEEPILLSAGLAGVLLLKTAAATTALRLVGLPWKPAFGMGLGLAQLGEFSFLVVAAAAARGLISPEDYSRILFIAIGTIILTPQLLKFGLRFTGDQPSEPDELSLSAPSDPLQRALLIGIGPIGRQIASRLETLGMDVCLVDLSPVNLHPFAQQGFHTVAGDARDPDVLHRAGMHASRLIVVCVPDDETGAHVVKTIREFNSTAAVVVRCRYVANVSAARSAGATAVVSEEAEASNALLGLCEQAVSVSGVLTSPTGNQPEQVARGAAE